MTTTIEQREAIAQAQLRYILTNHKTSHISQCLYVVKNKKQKQNTKLSCIKGDSLTYRVQHNFIWTNVC